MCLYLDHDWEGARFKAPINTYATYPFVIATLLVLIIVVDKCSFFQIQICGRPLVKFFQNLGASLWLVHLNHVTKHLGCEWSQIYHVIFILIFVTTCHFRHLIRPYMDIYFITWHISGIFICLNLQKILPRDFILFWLLVKNITLICQK